MNQIYDADVIIIGGGAGGAVAAKELCEKGIRVLLTEAGPWYGNSNWPEPNKSMGSVSSSNYNDLSIDLLKKSFTDLEDDMNDLVTGKFRWGPANTSQPPWQRIGGLIWQNAGVGGSTLHYFANSPRAYPLVVDNIWPITYQELIPYYERMEAELPVYPAPVTAKEELFYFGANKEGWQYINTKDVTTPGYRPQPNAIFRVNPSITDPNFDFNNNRSVGCTLRGHCVNGCHIGPTVDSVAKRSTLVSHIPQALRTGNLTVMPNTFVTQILTESGGTEGLKATGVKTRNTWTGETSELRAKVIVMAAGGIESPRLWLNSALPANPWVGRGLVNHLFDSMTGVFDENVLLNTLGISDIKPFVGQNGAARLDYPGLGFIMTIGITPGLYSSILFSSSTKGYSFMNQPESQAPWNVEGAIIGEALKEVMMDYTRCLNITIFTDDDVDINNGISLDPLIKDEHGFIPVINYQPSVQSAKRREQLAVIAANILKAAGARTIIRANWPSNIYIHIMGTMRMGYVTDTNCEAHQVKRLFITDNSVLFNSLGGPNPTLTTQALAVRTSEKIIEHYFQG